MFYDNKPPKIMGARKTPMKREWYIKGGKYVPAVSGLVSGPQALTHNFAPGKVVS